MICIRRACYDQYREAQAAWIQWNNADFESAIALHADRIPSCREGLVDVLCASGTAPRSSIAPVRRAEELRNQESGAALEFTGHNVRFACIEAAR